MDDVKRSEASYEESIKQLWDVIKRAGAEKRAEIISTLDQKTITALRTLSNPYKKPVISGGRYRFLAFNVINMTEKYCQRFAMTSLIGFIYRMLEEYKPDSEYISEDDPKFSEPYNKKVRSLIVSRPEELLLAEFERIKAEIAGATERGEQPGSELVKNSFLVRARIIKYRNFLVREDMKQLKTKLDLADRDVRTKRGSIQQMVDKLKQIQAKIEKLTSSDKPIEMEHRFSDAKVTRTPDEMAKALEEEAVRINETLVKYKATLTELESRLAELTKENDALQSQLAEYQAKHRELKTEYDRVFPSKKRGSGILDEIEVEKYEPSEDELNQFAEATKQELGIAKTAEEHADEVRDMVQGFLDQYLRYNPDTHVKCAYKPNYDDPSRTPIKVDKTGTIQEDTPERAVIPPDDTFFRWNRYVENNYEPLRQACDDIYAEKSDFEFDLVPLEVFDGDTQEEAEEKFNQYKRKYADEFEADIFCASFASHNLLSSWYQNRQVRDFYTERTEIIKRILDQNKEDAKYGQKIIKERAKQKDKDKGQKQYLAANPPRELEAHGAVHMDKLESPDVIDPKYVPVDMHESNKDEVEMDVHVIRPKIQSRNGRRRVRGFAEQWKFNISAEPIKDGQATIQTPAEFQKKILEEV